MQLLERENPPRRRTLLPMLSLIGSLSTAGEGAESHQEILRVLRSVERCVEGKKKRKNSSGFSFVSGEEQEEERQRSSTETLLLRSFRLNGGGD